jgi:hypothetical protein
VVTAAIAVLWCIAAAEEHHDLLTETALPTVLSTMTDHVENARVQENCSGFLFSLSSTVRCGTRHVVLLLTFPLPSLSGLALGFLRFERSSLRGGVFVGWLVTCPANRI